MAMLTTAGATRIGIRNKPPSSYMGSFQRYHKKWTNKLVCARCCKTSGNGSSGKPADNSHPKFVKDFSKLSQDIPCDLTDLWTSVSLYFCILHVPLGVGGLSIISKLLNQKDLTPEVKAISLVFTQTLELIGAILLVKSTYNSIDPVKMLKLHGADIWNGRGWLKGSFFGISVIFLAVILSSFAMKFLELKDTKTLPLQEILSSTNEARISCFLVYGLITPMLEEYMYRGLLLTSLISSMEWPLAVFISSCTFTLAHFSIENTLQLFFIGCILGCAYIWTGNLMSPLLIHGLYNISILITIILN